MKQTYAILDLQFGSTGKGLLAGYLARKRKPDGVVCAFGPNAGHTFIDSTGRKFVHIMMPMGALSPEIQRVFIGPGAIVHPDLLLSEHQHLQDMGYRYELYIHENATVVQERHREMEAIYGGAIGSTQKGTGAALAEKITRQPAIVSMSPDVQHAWGKIIARDVLKGTPLEGYVAPVPDYNDAMDKVRTLQIEGAQGYSLSCHHGFYPYVTSRDCTIGQLLADCAVPLMRGAVQVLGTCRTFPIRVNNKTGSSGPAYHDQEEIQWADLGMEPELTTVTKLPRRIFSFSAEQVRQAVRISGVDIVFLNFCNYVHDKSRLNEIIAKIESAGCSVGWLGHGPAESDVEDLNGVVGVGG